MNWLRVLSPRADVFLPDAGGFEADFSAFLPAARAHAAAFPEDMETTFAVAGRGAGE